MRDDGQQSNYLQVLPILGLLAFASALFAFYVGENLADGARDDFLEFNYPSVQVFAQLPLHEAVADYPAAGGPMFYLVFSPLAADPLYVRIASFLIMLASVVLTGLVVARLCFPQGRSREATAAAWIIATAMLLSPWVRSSGIWANNDIFSLFLLAAGLWFWTERARRDAAWPLAAALFCALAAALTRQLFLPFLLYFCVASWAQPRRATDRPMALIALLAGASVFGLLFSIWGGLTPPQYQRAHLALNWFGPFHAAAMAAIYLAPALLVCFRRQHLVVLPLVAALIVVFGWLVGADFAGINGGFIFTKLAAIVDSPLLFIFLVAFAAAIWGLALDDTRELPLRLFLFALFFGQFLISRTLYQKYIDLPAYLVLAMLAPLALRDLLSHRQLRFAPLALGLGLMITTTLYYG